MRDDYQGAVAALRLLAKAISSAAASDDKRRLRAYLVKVGRAFRDQPILQAALMELRARERHDEETFAQREFRVVQAATVVFTRVATILDPGGPIRPETLHAIEQHSSVSARERSPASLKEMFKEAQASRFPIFTLDDLPIFRRVADRLLATLQNAEDRDPHVSGAITQLSDVPRICDDADLAIETRRLLSYLSTGRNTDLLLDYANAWDAALRGENFRAHPTHLIQYHEGLEREALVIIDQVVEQLELRTVRRFALHRIRLFFEQFEFSRLRRELKKAETDRQSREAVLQRELDRFLFLDGYYPLTHTSASRGYTDTTILERVERAGVPPILIELKQVTAFRRPPEASRRALEKAITTARGEVQRYRGAIASRPQWSGVLPFIVVIHTCSQDVSDLEAEDIILIDLSTTTPSKKTSSR